MHAKIFKNQTRYNLDKTPSKPRRHTKVWQDISLSKLYQRSKSTHDKRYQLEKISSENKIQREIIITWGNQIKDTSRNEILNSKKIYQKKDSSTKESNTQKILIENNTMSKTTNSQKEQDSNN